ncbi:predicted protein [Coccidioides posadasii str. Silveira]|uniref:Predicted protein n=1 Tax=Coccidioides posadasii (strain RMSCC 757 / Silveira) TaxID=443226 RepID=E9CV59_COCPS|nr:predicted protein [Coccidioides posadasii str. Silveira]
MYRRAPKMRGGVSRVRAGRIKRFLDTGEEHNNPEKMETFFLLSRATLLWPDEATGSQVSQPVKSDRCLNPKKPCGARQTEQRDTGGNRVLLLHAVGQTSSSSPRPKDSSQPLKF